MTRRAIGLLVILCVATAGGCVKQPAPEPMDLAFAPKAGATVGTYDTRAVALAWGRSDAHNKEVKALVAEHREAEGRGDKAMAKEIADQLEARQERIHGQVFGDDPIPDIMARIADRLPEIRKAAGVEQLVSSREYAGAEAEAVDVTPLVAREFAPDEKTLKIMGQIKDHPPVKVPCCKR